MSTSHGFTLLPVKATFLTFVMLFAFTAIAAQQASMVVAELDKGSKFEELDETKPVDSANLITATTYVFSSMGGVAMEDMSTGTTQLLGPALDDTASAVTDLGFDFWFDGVRNTQFSCNANGLCRLGPVVVTTTFTNSLATTTAAPKITPFWDDLCTGTDGKVHFKVVGSPGSRKIVIEWLNMKITRNGSCVAPVGNGSFQMWLFESTGVIQFVYPALGPTTADGGYSIGLQSGVATNFASVTTMDNSVSYTAANNTQMTAIPAGTSYIFTPVIPLAPTGLNFTGVGAVTLTANWTDNASNEVGYVVYRSTDGVNFTFQTQLAANSTSYTDAPLSPSTNYFYRIYAVSEGGLSSVLAGSQMTNALGNKVSVASGGNWSTPATWVGGEVPTSSDQVTIVDGATVTIDVDAAAYNVTVGQSTPLSRWQALVTKGDTGFGAGAVLQFESATARTLTVGNDVLIHPGSAFRSSLTGTVTTHSLILSGDLTNNGQLDFSTNTDTAGAGITFTGANDAAFAGTGPVTDVRTITVNKGTSRTPVVELMPTNFSVQGVTMDNAGSGYLTLTNGTFKISGMFTASLRTFGTAAYTIPATAGLWLNNPNYSVPGQNGSPTLAGLFRMSQGTFNIGVASGNSMGFSANSEIRVEGGAINAAGRFGVAAAGNAITYNQSGGTITVQTVGNTSTTLAGFDMGTSTASTVLISGGNIVVQNANTAATTPRDYRLQSGSATTSNGISGVTGGMLQLSNASTAAVQSFNIAGVVPNLVLGNTGGNHTATWGAAVTWNNISRNITVSTGTTMNFGNQVFLMNGVTLTNNGTVTHNGASSRFIWFLADTVQTYTGSGTVTAPMTSFETQNGSTVIDAGSTQIVTNRFISFIGNLYNAYKLTIGSGGTTAATMQFGNTSAGAATDAGSFDSAPTFNPGTGGVVMSYLRTTTARTTGFEVPPSRILQNMTYDDNDPTHKLTVMGGNLQINGTMTLSNGVVDAGPNVITHNGTVTRTNGWVNGTLNRSYAATGTYTYHVGANGYSPVAANITTLTTNPSTLSARAIDSFLPSLDSGTSLSRYWVLMETGDLTADLTFTYLQADANGNEDAYKVWRRSGGTTTEVAPSTINSANNTAMVTGQTQFSDWGVGETLAAPVASASISGRVTNSTGLPVAVAKVVLTDAGGVVATALTSPYGYYSFGNIPTGSAYTVTVSRKGHTFTPSSLMFILYDNIGEVNFSGTASLFEGEALPDDKEND